MGVKCNHVSLEEKRRWRFDRQKRRSHWDYRSRDWNDEGTSQGMEAYSLQKLEKVRKVSPQELLKEMKPCRPLDFSPMVVILDFCPSELQENKLLFF